jgi:hypothetical protein
VRREGWVVVAGGKDGGEVGLGDAGGEFFRYVAFVLEGQRKGADSEAGLKGVVEGDGREA